MGYSKVIQADCIFGQNVKPESYKEVKGTKFKLFWFIKKGGDGK